jgi:hypothetical protein
MMAGSTGWFREQRGGFRWSLTAKPEATYNA